MYLNQSGKYLRGQVPQPSGCSGSRPRMRIRSAGYAVLQMDRQINRRARSRAEGCRQSIDNSAASVNTKGTRSKSSWDLSQEEKERIIRMETTRRKNEQLKRIELRKQAEEGERRKILRQRRLRLDEGARLIRISVPTRKPYFPIGHYQLDRSAGSVEHKEPISSTVSSRTKLRSHESFTKMREPGKLRRVHHGSRPRCVLGEQSLLPKIQGRPASKASLLVSDLRDTSDKVSQVTEADHLLASCTLRPSHCGPASQARKLPVSRESIRARSLPHSSDEQLGDERALSTENNENVNVANRPLASSVFKEQSVSLKEASHCVRSWREQLEQTLEAAPPTVGSMELQVSQYRINIKCRQKEEPAKAPGSYSSEKTSSGADHEDRAKEDCKAVWNATSTRTRPRDETKKRVVQLRRREYSEIIQQQITINKSTSAKKEKAAASLRAREQSLKESISQLNERLQELKCCRAIRPAAKTGFQSSLWQTGFDSSRSQLSKPVVPDHSVNNASSTNHRSARTEEQERVMLSLLPPLSQNRYDPSQNASSPKAGYIIEMPSTARYERSPRPR